MRACWYTVAGPAREVLQCGELPRPHPGPGEVRVCVAFAGVNPTDVKRRSGTRGPLPYPRVIPGYDAAGFIDAVGTSVDAARIGERVWIWEAAHGSPDGASAEYVTVPESRAMPLPKGTPLEAGAVGNYAIQLAKRMGATVIATARDADKAEDARRAGADHVTPADVDRLGEIALEVTGGRGVRHMLDVDLGAHLGHAWRFIAEHGSLASYGSQHEPNPPLPFVRHMYRNLSLHGIAIFNVPEAAKRRAAAFVQRALEEGALVHRFDRRYPLTELAAAHERQESGAARGKILVEV